MARENNICTFKIMSDSQGKEFMIDPKTGRTKKVRKSLRLKIAK